MASHAFQGWASTCESLPRHLVQGRAPLFFLDTSPHSLVPESARIVTGMAKLQGSGLARWAANRGMPGVYLPGATDVAGTIVGVADRGALWPQTEQLSVGDLLVGLASDSPHTNGYSLIRLLLEQHEPDAEMLEFLLTPHRCYLGDIDFLQGAGIRPKALAHITGGGVIENPPRACPMNWELDN